MSKSSKSSKSNRANGAGKSPMRFLSDADSGIAILDGNGATLVAGKGLSTLVNKEDKESFFSSAIGTDPEFRSAWRTGLREPKPVDFGPIRVAFEDGTHRSLVGRISPLSIGERDLKLLLLLDVSTAFDALEEMQLAALKLEALEGNLSSSLVFTDAAGKIIDCNQHAKSLLGSAKVAAGLNLFEAIPEQAAFFSRSFKRLEGEESSISAEMVIQGQNQTRVAIMATICALKKDGLENKGFLCVFEDITESRLHERLNRQRARSLELVQSVLEIAGQDLDPAGMLTQLQDKLVGTFGGGFALSYLFDRSGRFLRLITASGVRDDALAGVDSMDRGPIYEAASRMVPSGWRPEDGEDTPTGIADLNARAILFIPITKERQALGGMCICSTATIAIRPWLLELLGDISAAISPHIAKAIDREQRAADCNYLELILDLTGEPAFVIDLAGNIVDATSATKKLFGYSKGELLGSKLTARIPRALADDFERALLELGTGGHKEFDAVLIDQNGREIPSRLIGDLQAYDGRELIVLRCIDRSLELRQAQIIEALEAVSVRAADAIEQDNSGILEAALAPVFPGCRLELVWVQPGDAENELKSEAVEATRDNAEFRSNQLQYFTDISQAGQWATGLRGIGFKSAVRVPLLAEDSIIGYLNLGFADEQALDSEDTSLLLGIARILVEAQTAVAVKRQLSEEAKKLLEVFNALDNALLICSTDGEIVRANRAATNVFGLKDNLSSGQPTTVSELFESEILCMCADTDSACEADIRALTVDGAKSMRVKAALFIDPASQNDLIALTVSGIDAETKLRSELKRAQGELRLCALSATQIGGLRIKSIAESLTESIVAAFAAESAAVYVRDASDPRRLSLIAEAGNQVEGRSKMIKIGEGAIGMAVAAESTQIQHLSMSADALMQTSLPLIAGKQCLGAAEIQTKDSLDEDGMTALERLICSYSQALADALRYSELRRLLEDSNNRRIQMETRERFIAEAISLAGNEIRSLVTSAHGAMRAATSSISISQGGSVAAERAAERAAQALLLATLIPNIALLDSDFATMKKQELILADSISRAADLISSYDQRAEGLKTEIVPHNLSITADDEMLEAGLAGLLCFLLSLTGDTVKLTINAHDEQAMVAIEIMLESDSLDSTRLPMPTSEFTGSLAQLQDQHERIAQLGWLAAKSVFGAHRARIWIDPTRGPGKAIVNLRFPSTTVFIEPTIQPAQSPEMMI